jgi:hypothetical protein
MFHVGQKIVCVDDLDDISLAEKLGLFIVGDLDGLTKGAIYTIRALITDPVTGVYCARLHEIHRQPMPYRGGTFEVGFRITRFRPVVEKKTDISIFTRILDDVSKRETVKCP